MRKEKTTENNISFEYLNNDTPNKKQKNDEDMKMHILTTNAKMFILCFLIMFWFLGIFFIRQMGYISENVSLLLSLPPFAIIGIIYVIVKNRQRKM